MDKLSYLLVLLSIVTSNIYLADSYALTASYLTQLGYNNQSIEIKIKDNNIDSIDLNAFNGYRNLKYLTIDTIYNHILLTIDLELFIYNVYLESLWLHAPSLNKLTNKKNLKFSYLTELRIYTNLTSLNKAMFTAFPALTSLSFASLDFYRVLDGNIKTVDVHTFENLSNLSSLVLTDNLITSFEYLQIPKNLKALYLGGNNMNYFALSRTMGVLDLLDVSRNLFRSFKSMDFAFLANLTQLSLSGNPHAYPNEIPGHLKHLVNLQGVYISNLSISSIDSGYFKNNTKLQTIDLSINKISSLNNRSFFGLNDLKYVVLTDNNLTKIESGTFSYSDNLEGVYLANNQISQIDNLSFKGNEAMSLYFNENKLTYLSSRAFEGKFNYIFLSYNQITEIDNSTFNGIVQITSIILTYNKIEKIGPGSFNFQITNLFLENNLLTELKDRSFVGQISFLSLSNNKIETIEAGTFNYGTIGYIDLSYNNLTEIRNTTFAGLNILRGVVLSNNKISTIESGTFANLPNLKYISLDKNQLTQLDSSMFSGSNNLERIDIRGNPNLSTTNIQSVCPPAAIQCQVYYYY